MAAVLALVVSSGYLQCPGDLMGRGGSPGLGRPPLRSVPPSMSPGHGLILHHHRHRLRGLRIHILLPDLPAGADWSGARITVGLIGIQYQVQPQSIGAIISECGAEYQVRRVYSA